MNGARNPLRPSFVWLLLCCLGSPVSAQPRDEGKALEQFCRNFPDGTEIAIGISENGVRRQLGFTKTGGRLEPSANAARQFELGSITKVFTAVLVAHAIREGRLSPETDIQSFYAFPLGYSYPGAITVGQLCTHTSGFRHDYPNFTPHLKGPRYGGPFPALDRDGLQGLLKKRRVLVGPPGSRLSYSNFGYAVLGDILTRTTGKSYAQLLREVVTGPLHLQGTTLAATDGLVPGRNAAGKVVRNSEGSAYDPVAHVKSSVTDMLTFMEYFFLKESALSPAFDLCKPVLFSRNATDHRSLGWFVNRPPGGEALFYHGGNTYGYTAKAAFAAGKKRAVVVLSNVTGTNNRVSDGVSEIIDYFLEKP